MEIENRSKNLTLLQLNSNNPAFIAGLLKVIVVVRTRKESCMLGLVINPAPEHDESLLGYLHRLGRCNALLNGEVIKSFKELTHEQIYAWMSEDIRPKSWSEMVEHVRKPKFNGKQVWSLTKLKYCPTCLASGIYWRELWDLTLYTTCTVHNVDLVYKCPRCNTSSSLGILTSERCDFCGCSVMQEHTPASNVEASKLWLSSELEKRLNSGVDTRDTGIDSLTYTQLHFLAVRLGVRALSCKYNINMTMAVKSSDNVAPEIAMAAGQVLIGWPHSFYRLLSDLMEVRSSNITFRLRSAFGLIYNDMYISLTDRCYDFVRDEFERFVVQNWEGPLAKRNRRLSECTLLGHRWLPYKKAAHMTGLPESFLRRMHFSGDLNAREFSYPCGKTVAVVDFEMAHRLSLLEREPLDLRQTARLLFLSRKRIEQLLRAGILKFFGGPPHAGEKWLVCYSSIVALSPAKFLSTPSDDFITISQIAKHYLPTSSGLVDLLLAIRDGQIPVYCRAESEALNIGKWLVNKNALLQKNITLTNSSNLAGMSVGEAAKILDVKEEVAYALVRLGQLRSETVQRSRRKAHVVSLEAIEHFNRNYILSKEIGKRLGVPVGGTLCHLREAGFLPVIGPTLSDAHCRQYVWRRSKGLTAYLASEAELDERHE